MGMAQIPPKDLIKKYHECVNPNMSEVKNKCALVYFRELVVSCCIFENWPVFTQNSPKSDINVHRWAKGQLLSFKIQPSHRGFNLLICQQIVTTTQRRIYTFCLKCEYYFF